MHKKSKKEKLKDPTLINILIYLFILRINFGLIIFLRSVFPNMLFQ